MHSITEKVVSSMTLDKRSCRFCLQLPTCKLNFKLSIKIPKGRKCIFFCSVPNLYQRNNDTSLMHQSIPGVNIPPGQPLGFCTYFQPGSWGFVPSELPGDRPGVGPIVKVPSCQLMPHEGTFQPHTDLPN